jgi:hypothetical protein
LQEIFFLNLPTPPLVRPLFFLSKLKTQLKNLSSSNTFCKLIWRHLSRHVENSTSYP